MSTTAAHPPMMTLDEALQRLTSAAAQHRLQAQEAVPTAQALGRVLASPVQSTLDVPPADNSAMDGYAVRFADLLPGAYGAAVLPISQRIAAGAPGQPLVPGTAARIFTGAQVPAGADTVLMQEICEALPAAVDVAGDVARVRISLAAQPKLGQAIRRRGEDVAIGATVLRAGTRLTPQALGLAAAVGLAELPVLRRPRVALFSTGDELAMPGEPLKPGAIYNSNRFTLRALLQAAGCEVQDLGIVPDRLDATRAALRTAAHDADLIVTSGGVSVGEEDHLRPAAQAEGRLDLWQIAIKPGKPLAFGAIRRGDDDASGEALFIGLPGNPVSSFVTFLVTVAPVLRALQGMPATLPQSLPLRAAFDWPRADKRREFLRVQITPEGELVLFDNQGSGVLTSTVWADGLVDNPAGRAIVRGDTVRFLPLANLIAA
ncbi:molybdopterin molybdotransferase MoeA [Ideonella azotifigens]|nr:gephyrin-like molybdotransferase Glp [Ideonella azotifigens]MCD2342960.1 molybdopterin molybdotransferase MoeA [Ideonella azotifigens]